MAVLTGADGQLKYQSKMLAKARDWTISVSKDALEDTHLGLYDRTYVEGLRGATGSMTVLYDPSQDEADYLIKHLEKDLRDLVCSTGKLDRPKSLAWDDSISFKILLKTNQSAELDMGLGGKWSPKQSSISHFQAGNRVIFNLANYGCQFQYRLISNEDRVSQSS